MTTTQSCSARVYSGARWDFGGRMCSRRGTVERDGKLYCTQHDPEKVALREEKRRAQERAERDRENETLRISRELIAILGGGYPEYSHFNHKPTGGVVLSRQEARALADRLASLEEKIQP